MWPEGNEGKLASPGVAVCGESRTHGDNGGDGETGRKVPRSVPTHSSHLVRQMCPNPPDAIGIAPYGGHEIKLGGDTGEG